VGTGGFSTAFSMLSREDLAFAGHEKEAHSGWLKVLGENGILGFLLFVAYVGSFAVAGFSVRDAQLRVLGTLATAVLAVGLLSTEFQNKDLWFFAASAAVILSRRGLTNGIPLAQAALAARGQFANQRYACSR
jgi:O-antigen ligase